MLRQLDASDRQGPSPMSHAIRAAAIKGMPPHETPVLLAQE